jgi:hypothetical protein
MALKIRILTRIGEFVSATSSTEELLMVLLDAQNGRHTLSQDEEDSLRGWLLLRAQELDNGKIIGIEGQPTVSIGKTAEGRPFVRDARGDWPPVKPNFE